MGQCGRRTVPSEVSTSASCVPLPVPCHQPPQQPRFPLSGFPAPAGSRKPCHCSPPAAPSPSILSVGMKELPDARGCSISCLCSKVTRCSARLRNWAPFATRWCEDRPPPQTCRALPRWLSINPHQETAAAPGFIALQGWWLQLHELLKEGSQLPLALAGAEWLHEVQKGPQRALRLLQHLGGWGCHWQDC